MKGKHTKMYAKFMEHMYPADLKAKLKSNVKQVDEKYGVVTLWEVQLSNWMFARALNNSEENAVKLIDFLTNHDFQDMENHLKALEIMIGEIPKNLLKEFNALPIITVEQLKNEIYAP